MNCFQICIFVSDFTTSRRSESSISLLWIAFKFVSLCRILQLLVALTHWWVVVNCFQICIFVSDFTTNATRLAAVKVLWIAFKFVSLCRILQHLYAVSVSPSVVNCFQICIFVSDFTTCPGMEKNWTLLWIAFKFVSLCRILQPEIFTVHRIVVVNCFQICIFVSDFTTPALNKSFVEMLWIAFKFVSLCRILQLAAGEVVAPGSCELLSNLYLCVGFYNLARTL